jgi:hypothetical protein
MINESSSIGEELLQGSPLSEMERKCLVVRQVVADGDFPLEEALELYEVPIAAFDDFMARYLLSVLQASISSSPSNQFKMLISTEVIKNMYKQLLFDIDNNGAFILKHLDALKGGIEEGKIRV